MMIQCLIQRDGPTEVVYDGFKYRFVKNDLGHLVCNVLNADHVKRFLNFPKSFRKYDPERNTIASIPGILKNNLEEVPYFSVATKRNGDPTKDATLQIPALRCELKENKTHGKNEGLVLSEVASILQKEPCGLGVCELLSAVRGKKKLEGIGQNKFREILHEFDGKKLLSKRIARGKLVYELNQASRIDP